MKDLLAEVARRSHPAGHGPAFAVAGDLSTREGAARLISSTLDEFGRSTS